MTGRHPWVDILAEPTEHKTARATGPEVTASPGLRVSHQASGFTGIVARCERDGVVIKGVTGLERIFRFTAGAFVVAGRAVTLVAPTPPKITTSPKSSAETTASGSRASQAKCARVARASRILVEGVHDAQLVERVWGHDLRVEGIVVERLDGLDHLAAVTGSDFGSGRIL